jgi:tRNA nucleotidyltransferase/poly(A) polymerase
LIEDFVRSLGLDAYLVGGAVRDELLGLESKDADFLVIGVDAEQLRAALAPSGRVEELVVAGRPVGVRLYPRDPALRGLAPKGIEFAPSRREVSTGPGRHDFDIVVDPGATVEEDLERRDFTINAMARKLADGTLVDPFRGQKDLESRVLRTVSRRSFEEDPLRLIRGLRFVSQLGLDPEEVTLAQMREHAGLVSVVSGERIGGGLAADGRGELSKLLLGREPRRALELARDTGVLVALLPEFGPSIGYEIDSEEHTRPLDEHILAVVQAAADGGFSLQVRLAALLHDLGKPGCPDGEDHAERGARVAAQVLRRLRYPTSLREWVVRIVRFHTFALAEGDALEARRMLARYGDALTFELLDHWHADLIGRDPTPRSAARVDQLAAFRSVVEHEVANPHRLADLAVNGSDLIGIGYTPGPALGQALRELLDEVVESPTLNRHETLLARARELLRA